ncbi:MAG: hypothetical protein AB4042_05110 [Leptolyngbyaceae cyanobacterium]
MTTDSGSTHPPPTVVLRRVSPKRSPQLIPLIYQSAIALQLAHQWQQPVTLVAHQLCSIITTLTACPQAEDSFQTWMLDQRATPSGDQITLALLHHTEIKPLPNGHLQIHVDPPALGLWLQWLLSSDLAAPPQPPISLSAIPFHLLWTHARCCTILRLAHRHGSITLKTHERPAHPQPPESSATTRIPGITSSPDSPGSPLWAIAAPTPLPWDSMFSPEIVPSKLGTDPQIPTSLPQSPSTPLSLYCSQIVNGLDAVESIKLTPVPPSLEQRLNAAAGVGLPPKLIQPLSRLSQQFQILEKQWTTHHWQTPTTHPPSSSHPLLLTYLGLVCLTQRILHLPFIGNIEVPLPDEL